MTRTVSGLKLNATIRVSKIPNSSGLSSDSSPRLVLRRASARLPHVYTDTFITYIHVASLVATVCRISTYIFRVIFRGFRASVRSFATRVPHEGGTGRVPN